MAGHRKWSDLRAGVAERIGEDALAAAERDELERYDRARAKLAEVRRARALTQVQLAQALEVSQAQVSRIERQGDLYLSTLAGYLEAMGGRLELRAVFDDAEPIDLDIGVISAAPAGQNAAGAPEEPAPGATH
jgi:DNA-binding XRE family transcriptional regulator